MNFSYIAYCENLTSLTIPDTITEIGYNAFLCTGDYPNKWENGVMYAGKHAVDCASSSGEYVIRTGTKTIAEGTFLDGYEITSVKIPSTVTHIGENAFISCAFENIDIPNSVEVIGDSAFKEYRNIK